MTKGDIKDIIIIELTEYAILKIRAREKIEVIIKELATKAQQKYTLYAPEWWDRRSISWNTAKKYAEKAISIARVRE